MLNLRTIALAALACLSMNASAQLNAALSASKSEVLQFLGTDSARLVFQCTQDADLYPGNASNFLWYVDYSAASPQAVQLAGTSGATLPCISPDGEWLTFATGVDHDEDAAAGGKAWVMRLPSGTPALVDSPAYLPRFYKDATGLYVMYLTKGGLNLYSDTTCLTKKRKIDAAGAPEGASITITKGGFAGGISVDGRYLSGAAQRSGILDLNNPGPLALVHRQKMHIADAAPRDTFMSAEQTCNPSHSQSALNPNAMLYIDLGFSKAKYTNLLLPGLDSWVFHQVIYIADNTAHFRKYFVAPSQPVVTACVDGAVRKAPYWGDPEWSTHPYFGTASLVFERKTYDASSSMPCLNTKTNFERIYFINFKDSTYLKVVQSNDTVRAYPANPMHLRWPFLWAKLPAGFAEATGWLPTYSDAVEKGAAAFPAVALQCRMEGSRLVSSLPLTSVVITDIRGRVAASLQGHSRSRIDLAGSVRAAGIYSIRVTAENGKRATFSWASVN